MDFHVMRKIERHLKLLLISSQNLFHFLTAQRKRWKCSVLGRNQGREDDNVETIRKRFKVFLGSSLPVIQYYESKWKVTKIDAGKPVDEVFESVKTIFASYEMRCFNIPRGQNVLLCVGGGLVLVSAAVALALKKKVVADDVLNSLHSTEME